MPLNLEELIKLLDTDDPKAAEFKKRVMSSLNDANELGNVLEQHCENRKQTNCYYCNDEGACLAIRGVAHLDLKRAEEAIQNIENANIHFRGKDETWNSIIGLELLGIAYEMRGRRHQALLEYQQALQQLNNYRYAHKNDYELADKIEDRESKLNDRLKYPIILSAGTPTIPVAPIPFAPDSASQNNGEPENYLSIPWIPIYENMQAGANGLNWNVPPNQEKTELNQVRLQGRQCNIHTVHSRDRRVVINPERQYAWGKVRGHSMEEATPTPICENDYVLFYLASAAENDSIVVVVQCGSGAGDSYMVKRIDLDNQLLFSQTNHKGAEYEPIPFDPDLHLIAGVVVAIAKPIIQEISSADYDPALKIKPGPESGGQNEAAVPFMITNGLRQQLLNQGYSEVDISQMTPHQAWDKIDEEKLFQNLLTKVLGDHEVANRLIEYEQRQKPRSSRKELINLAIIKWEKDNR